MLSLSVRKNLFTFENFSTWIQVVSHFDKTHAAHPLYERNVLLNIYDMAIFNPSFHSLENGLKTKNLSVVQLCIEEVSKYEYDLEWIMHNAVGTKDAEILKYIADYVHLNGWSMGKFAAFKACELGRLDLLKILEERGYQTDYEDFIAAIQRGHLDLVKHMSHHVDDYMKLLSMAIKFGRIHLISYFLSRFRPHRNQIKFLIVQTIHHIRHIYPSSEIMRLLIEQDPSLITDETIISAAILYGTEEVIQLLNIS